MLVVTVQRGRHELYIFLRDDEFQNEERYEFSLK